MTIAVTDACIFFDLLDLELTSDFFNLQLDIHTTIEVWNEIDYDQQSILNHFRKKEKLTIHILESDLLSEMDQISFPRGLSQPDRSVVFIAKKLGAKLLSSDGLLRKFSTRQSIPTHGMLWILDKLVEEGILAEQIAFQKLSQLTTTNQMYLGNQRLQKEIKLRLEKWGKY